MVAAVHAWPPKRQCEEILGVIKLFCNLVVVVIERSLYLLELIELHTQKMWILPCVNLKCFNVKNLRLCLWILSTASLLLTSILSLLELLLVLCYILLSFSMPHNFFFIFFIYFCNRVNFSVLSFISLILCVQRTVYSIF